MSETRFLPPLIPSKWRGLRGLDLIIPLLLAIRHAVGHEEVHNVRVPVQRGDRQGRLQSVVLASTRSFALLRA